MFYLKIFFLKMILGTRRKNFWKPYQKTWAKKSAKILLRSRKEEKNKKGSQKDKLLFARLRTRFSQKCRKNVVNCQKFFLSKIRNKKNTHFTEKKMFFFSKWYSVRVECSSDGRNEVFHQSSDFFCWKTKKYQKAVTLFSGNPLFHQLFVCTRKMPFWQLRRKFCAKSVKKTQSQISKLTENWKLLQKYPNTALATEKRSFVYSVEKRSLTVAVKLFSSPSPKKTRKTKFVQEIIFSSKRSSVHV